MIWNWWGAPGLLVLVLGWSGAIVALRAGRGRVNRLLAAVLVLEGIYGAGNFGLIFFVAAPEVARVLAVLGAVAMATLPLQYLVFLGGALRTPLVGPLRRRLVVSVLHTATAVAAAWVIARPATFITDLYQPAWAPWNFSYAGLGPRVIQFHGVVSLFALVVSIHAYRLSASDSTARNQAIWFIVAFGLRDAFIGMIQILMPILRPIPFWGDLIYNPLHGTMYAVYVPLLAYAILRHQLLNLDLRIRFALTSGSVGALIAGSFLVVSEVLESVVPVEGPVLGVMLAVVIAASLRPAQRVAERIADLLMPGVSAAPAYLDRRRAEIYRGALESALADGEISRQERDILDRLRSDLDLGPEVTRRLEQEVGLCTKGSEPAEYAT